MAKPPLASTGVFSPFIHNAGRVSPSRYRQKGFSGNYSYRLGVLHDGSATITCKRSGKTESVTIRSGGAFLTWPALKSQITFATGTQLQFILLDLVCADQNRNANSVQQPQELPQSQRQVQPAPEDLWGVTMPVAFPPELVPRVSQTVAIAAAAWWRSASNFTRACSHVGLLLSEFAHWCEGEQAIELTGNEPDLLRRMFAIVINEETVPTIAALADRLSVSREHLSRVFKHHHRNSLNQWLTRQRLRQAVLLLSQPDLKTSTIAERCGYASSYGFCQAFRRLQGVTPSEFRRHTQLE